MLKRRDGLNWNQKLAEYHHHIGEVFDVSELSTEIINELQNLGDPAQAANLQRFFKTAKGEYGEGDKFLGVRVPVLRAFAKKYRDAWLEDVLEVLHSQYHEARLLALYLLVELFQKADDQGRSQIYDEYLAHVAYINNWDLVDSSALQIVGQYLFNKERSPLLELARSKNLWERRIAIIASFYFIRHHDFKSTLEISEILLNDKEDLIHKAVGWMLREVGNRSQSVEEQFLHRHYKEMPRTMLRYAIERFPEELRQSYLKGEIGE
ncbi:MAG: DNA alkylation repair protein [Candidatus Marinimicrobia bacterium]|nr:DNA alkylation repair protein [Candidatus Neomarinimicrobiota bacterium]